ncbi:MAG: hypothetical protein U0892_19005 [Pirellulales bacterium]
MSESPEVFAALSEINASSGRTALVDWLIAHLEKEHRYHELFEALKMRVRLDLGLSAAQTDRDERLDADTELKLERGLIDACKRVGEGLLSQGKVREGWMYMRPVGDREAAAAALRKIQPDDENVDALLEVFVHEGVDVGAGYALALSRMGTCNSITLFETAIAGRPRKDQQVAAGLLVEHVHGELIRNLRHDIARRESKEPTEQTAAELLASRPTLLRDGSYHLDTTHLASTVRFARVLDDKEQLKLALDLTSYGRHLHPQFQYPGEEPFLDLYPSSAAFFRALLGEQVDAGIRYFTQKADVVDRDQYGNVAIEVLIDLLSRVGRHEQALQEYARRLPIDARLMGIAPTMLDLSHRIGSYEAMRNICKDRDDLLGYAVALLHG